MWNRNIRIQENLVGSTYMNSSQVEYQQMGDLADSEDEVAVSAVPENARSRRKLRMVIDPEDDD
ncbi:hypothetical protein E2542_SST22881 [Spatholobus suberectus]|nr:hypothetical protein E2542_SST22881 [Spatholobus suberectus]